LVLLVSSSHATETLDTLFAVPLVRSAGVETQLMGLFCTISNLIRRALSPSIANAELFLRSRFFCYAFDPILLCSDP
jgi:hypothetical protein